MRANKYLVAAALLAVLAIAFGLAGTVAPVPEMVSPEHSSSSSDSATHFMNPPTFDSGWVNITDECEQYFTLKHNLNTTEVLVSITGKQSLVPASGTLVWNQTYGGTNHEAPSSVVQTVDGGYAIGGETLSFGAGNYDAWLVKTDSTGNMQWNQTYGGTGLDLAYSMVQTSDGGYALAGITGADFWLVKTDSAGNMQWNQTYGGARWESAWSVVQTVDGGYAIAGETNDYSAAVVDFWLVKTDSAGNMEWDKMYGAEDEDCAESVVQTSDGGYALAGWTYSFAVDAYDGWLVKTDSAGNMQWNQTYGGTGWDLAYSMVQTSDGGYAILGETDSYGAGNFDIWLVKTDSAGNMQWNQTYGGTGYDAAWYGLVQTVDGGYALAGYTESYGVGGDCWLVKTDSAGNMEWDKMYGAEDEDAAHSMVQTSDGGYAIAGYTASFGAGERDFWLVKVHVEMNIEHQRNLGDDETGLAWTGLTNHTIILYRGETDPYWNYVRVRIWTIKEPTWMFGDINQDGVVDAQDLAILGKNYGKTFSLLSLTGIMAVAGIHTYKKRKRPK